MKVVLFCGGQGLRMRNDMGDNDLPKPMVMLGTRPILWHLMKYYAHFGHKEFILCLGHKGTSIKKYFVEYEEWISNDFVISGTDGNMRLVSRDLDEWSITLVDTGNEANIGERLLTVRPYLQNEEVFLANYADGLTDCDLSLVVDRLRISDAVGACMVTRPNISMHFVDFDGAGLITRISTPEEANTWINAGFFAFTNEIFKYIHPGEELVEQPFTRLIKAGRLASLPFDGFWRCCDTFKDLRTLEALLVPGPAPWELWRRPPKLQPAKQSTPLQQVANGLAAG